MTSQQKKINKLKYNAYLLKCKFQLPSILYYEIIRIDYNTDIDFIKKLMSLTKDYLRIEGYYRNDEKMKLANNQLNEILTN